MVGGSGRWMWELYRRVSIDDVVVVAGDHRDAKRFDAAHELSVYRMPLKFADYGTFSLTGLNRYRAAARQVEQITQRHSVSAIHASALLPDGWIGLLVAKQLGIPLLLYFHGEELCYTETSRQLKWMTNRILKQCAVVVVNSENSRAIAIERLGVAGDKLRLMHPGVDHERFAPANPDVSIRRRLGWEGRLVLLSVSRLQKRKGHEHLIRALPAIRRQFADVLYAIVGDGQERTDLERLVNELKLQECVRFYGEPSEAEMVEYYQQCDIFILPNCQIGDDVEGFGIVLLEAQACAKPVIAGDTGGTADALELGVTGQLVDPRDRLAITRTVCDLIGDSSLRTSMGIAARRMVEREYRWDMLASQAMQLFSDLPAGRAVEATV